MIRIPDGSLAGYFASIKEGQELSREQVSKHLALYSFDFEGVTGQHDLQKFRVTSPGEITEKAGLVQSRIKLSPVFEDPSLKNRRKLALEFNKSIATQAYNRSKSAIEMQIIRQNGLDFTGSVQNLYQMSFNIDSNNEVREHTGVTKPVNNVLDTSKTPFSIRKNGDNIRLVLPEATRKVLTGTDLYNEIYTELLMGEKKGLKFDKESRTFIQSDHVEEVSKVTRGATGKYVPRKDDITNNESSFLEKLDRMLKQTPSTDPDLDDIEHIVNTLTFEDASRIESMSAKQILEEYPDIKKMIEGYAIPSAQDEANFISEADKRLGVDAKQETKNRLIEELRKERTKELVLEQTKEFKEEQAKAFSLNAKMYAADRRDYLDSGNRVFNPEDQWDDIYKEAYYIKKAEEEKDKYLNRIRKATHTQLENGSWVKNDRLPNRVADRTRQAIAIDMNPDTVTDNLTKSLLSTMQLAQENLAVAKESIQSETDKLKEQRQQYNRLFENHNAKQKPVSEIDLLIADKVASYKLWSGSVSNSFGWIDRAEIDYLMGDGQSDTKYYDTYIDSKKYGAFQFASKKEVDEHNAKVEEYKQGIRREATERYKSFQTQVDEASELDKELEDIFGKKIKKKANEAVGINEMVETILNERKAEAQLSARNEVMEVLRSTQEEYEKQETKQMKNQVLKEREVKIARILKTHFADLQEATELPTGGSTGQHLSIERLTKADELFAKKNNVEVDELFMPKADTVNVSNYIRISTELKALEERHLTIDPTSEEYASSLASIRNARGSLNYIAEDMKLQDGLSRNMELSALQSEINEQSAKVASLNKVIQNKGYEEKYGRTVFNKETGELEHVGISKDMYEKYIENPEKLEADTKSLAAENSFNKQRRKASNRESWYRALGTEQIVKGHYNDERGFKVIEINPDTNVAYLARPAMKVSSLQYSTDIDNKELIQNIESVDESLVERFNPSNQDAESYKAVHRKFEDIDTGHVTLYAEIPAIKYIEPEVSEQYMARKRQSITTYLNNSGNVRYESLPKWASYQLDQFIQESSTQQMNVLDDIEVARQALVNAKKKGVPTEDVKFYQEQLKAEQDRLRAVSREQASIRNSITDRILEEIKEKRINSIVKRNDRVQREIELFGFEQGKDNARMELSRKGLEKILLGDSSGITKFYNKMIDGHLPHFRNSVDNATGSLGAAILNVIDDHISQQTEFDLRDETLTRKFMQRLDPDALAPSDLSEINQAKLKTYIGTLPNKSIDERVRDSLFKEILDRTLNVEYGDKGDDVDGTGSIIKRIYNEMLPYGPESDITGQSMYSFIHNKDSAIHKDLKSTYQARVLRLSPNELDELVTQYKTVGTLSIDAISEKGQEIADMVDDTIGEDVKSIKKRETADERLTSYEEPFLSEEIERPAPKSNKVSNFNGLLDRDIDMSDLKDIDLSPKNWDRLIEKIPHMEKVKDLITRSSIKSDTPLDPDGTHKARVARLSVYAMGALNNKEAKYQSVLRLEDAVDIFDENLMNKVLADPKALNERQISTTLELAESLGKKINVRIPIGERNFSDGYLRFNEANEVEAYSPALKQAYLINDSGASKTSTVRMDDMRAYGSDNRLKAAKSYSKQQPILKQSIANEGQMKRSGNSLMISNVDSSFGELMDFVETGKVGISYDIETTMTNPNKLKSVVQPIEIYAQQIQMNPETGELYRDAQGNFAVREDTMETVIDSDGNSQQVKGSGIVAKDYHAIMSLEQPSIDLINKIAADDNYFDIGQAQGNRVHIVDFINANRSDGQSNVDFIQGLLGKKLRKNKASALMNELTTKAEEYQFLNNVAKYSFGANKTEHDIERFGVYGSAKAVDSREEYAAHLKNENRTLYNEFYNSDGVFNKDNTNYFRRLTYEHQTEQTKVLVRDALKATENLNNPDFDFGNGVKPVSVADGISGFVDFQQESGSDVFFVQNGEIADNKTLTDSARLIDKRNNRNTEVFSDGLKHEVNKISAARDELFQTEIAKFTDEFADKFGIHPRLAQRQRAAASEILLEPNRDKVGYLKSQKKVWVNDLKEALEYLPELNRTTSNIRFTPESYKEADKQLNTYTTMIEKLLHRSGEYTAEERGIAKQLNLFDGNLFSLSKNTVFVPKLEKKVQQMYDNAGISDQQNVSRIVNSELRSQSNAALMAAQNFNSELAHDGKVDTIFGSQNVERFTKDIFTHMRTPESGDSPLSYILRSMDAGNPEDGSFMERNAYRGDGTEYISFTERPEEGIQKGVYRLLGFNKSGTEATMQRVIQGQEGIIDDVSLEPVKLPAQTNAELAHKFAQSVRYVPEENVSTEIANYTKDISRRHFDKILANNLSYDSHMNQIREMEIESGAYTRHQNNPLFAIDDAPKRPNLLEASMEDLMEVTESKGAIKLESNPLERARKVFKEDVEPKELLHVLDNDPSVAISDVDRALIRNTDLLEDRSKEKFYNKEMTKEQVLALQDINDFHHTDLGIRLSELMDDVTALESQGLVSPAEKADLLSTWNENLKEKAKENGRTYKVQDTAVLPSFMLDVANKETGSLSKIPIESNIQISSPTEIAKSLQGIAGKIGELKEYSSAKDMAGLKEDYALNKEVVPHLKNLGVLDANDIEIEPGKNRFMGLGELSHMVYNNLQQKPDLLERATAVDYLELAKNMSDEDLQSIDNTTKELLGKYFARQTDVQALQFEGLKESRQMLRDEGLYMPGMKLQTGSYSLEDVEDLKQYSTSSFLGQRSTGELVGMADQLAGSGSSADKERTKLIYKEIVNRAATAEDGTKNIDPQAIINSGNHRRIEAAAAMDWIKPITQNTKTNMYTVNGNIAERRIGYGQFAGARLGDIPETSLDTQAYHAYKNMSLPNYDQRYSRMPYLQQQEMIANWSDTGYDGHDHLVDNKYYTARGERPNLAAANEQIKAEHGGQRRNETPASLSLGNEDSIEGWVEKGRTDNPTQFFANNEAIASKLNIHPSVSPEDVQAKAAEVLEMKEPTGHHSSPIDDFISRKKADFGDAVGSLLEGTNGSKWVAGLGVAAAALFAVNAMNSTMKLETRPAGHGVQGVTGTPEDDTSRSNKQAENRESLSAPNVQTGGTSYVSSGEKGYTIKASGKAPSNIDSSQLQSTINSSMDGTSGVNINLRDDRSSLDSSWLETQFSNFIERGSVGGG